MAQKEKKILIVEDEASLLSILSHQFQERDYKVYTAKNGKEGFLKAQKNKPDIILLDIVMPIMNGIDMLEKIRQTEWGKNIKVIVLTNLNTKEEIVKSLHGNAEYLIKANWKLNDIIDKVNKIVK